MIESIKKFFGDTGGLIVCVIPPKESHYKPVVANLQFKGELDPEGVRLAIEDAAHDLKRALVTNRASMVAND